MPSTLNDTFQVDALLPLLVTVTTAQYPAPQSLLILTEATTPLPVPPELELELEELLLDEEELELLLLDELELLLEELELLLDELLEEELLLELLPPKTTSTQLKNRSSVHSFRPHSPKITWRPDRFGTLHVTLIVDAL